MTFRPRGPRVDAKKANLLLIQADITLKLDGLLFVNHRALSFKIQRTNYFLKLST